jgi:hypothetical protein
MADAVRSCSGQAGYVFLLVVLKKNLVSAESQGQNRSESLTGISPIVL